jgi:hypothetical protein
MRLTLSAALEKFRDDNDGYPPVQTGEQIAKSLTPKYLREMPTDAYGRPFVITISGTTPVVTSLGRGGFVVQKQRVIECHPYTTEGCR